VVPLSHSHQYLRPNAADGMGSYLKVVDLPAYFKEQPALDEAPSYFLVGSPATSPPTGVSQRWHGDSELGMSR